MSIQGRISKLEEGIPAQGCARCHGDGKLRLEWVTAVIQAADDGTDPPPSHGCPACGWLETEILRLESEEEALREPTIHVR